MTTALYDAQTAATANRPEFRVMVEGIPYDWTTNNALYLTSYTPPYIGATPYRKLVKSISLEDDSVDRTTGRTEFGGATVALADAGDVLTALFRRTASLAILLGDGAGGVMVTADGPTWAVPDASLFTVGRSYCCGRETVRCTGRDLGADTITVTRGMYGSIATPHWASTDEQPHDDEIYEYAPHWAGRMLSIYFEYDVPTFAGPDAHLRFCGPIDSIKLGADGSTWEIGAKSALAQLGGAVGGLAYRGTIGRDAIYGPGAVVLQTSGTSNNFYFTPDPGTERPVEPAYLRLGSEVMSTRAIVGTDGRWGFYNADINHRGEVGTPGNHPAGTPYREVLITKFNPGPVTAFGDPPYPFGYLYGGPPPATFVRSSHPIMVLLNLACSTWTGDNYDPSFAPLGAAYGPVSFDTMNQAVAGARRGARLGRGVPWYWTPDPRVSSSSSTAGPTGLVASASALAAATLASYSSCGTAGSTVCPFLSRMGRLGFGTGLAAFRFRRAAALTSDASNCSRARRSLAVSRFGLGAGAGSCAASCGAISGWTGVGMGAGSGSAAGPLGASTAATCPASISAGVRVSPGSSSSPVQTSYCSPADTGGLAVGAA